MTDYGQVVWGLISTLLAFFLGLAWRRLSRFITYRRARRFWRPLLRGHVNIVLGRFRDLQTFEASGMVGVGDNIALNTLTEHFARIGFRQFKVFYNDQLGWNESVDRPALDENLVLLGGPDANHLTKLVLQRLALGVEFLEVSPRHLEGRPTPPPRRGRVRARLPRRATPASSTAAWRVPVFRDIPGDRLLAPLLSDSVIVQDCGLVIRCVNPFNITKQVIILCGCYGYGTWGAAQFVQSSEFLSRVRSWAGGIECVLAMEVVNEVPINIGIELLRPLDPDVVRPDGTVIVPRVIE